MVLYLLHLVKLMDGGIATLGQYGDGADNTTEKDSSILSLIGMC